MRGIGALPLSLVVFLPAVLGMTLGFSRSHPLADVCSCLLGSGQIPGEVEGNCLRVASCPFSCHKSPAWESLLSLMLTGVSVESKALAMKQSQNNCLVADGLEELCLCVEAEDTRAGGRCVVAKALQEVQEEQSLCKGLVQGSSEISALERLHSFCISDSSAEASPWPENIAQALCYCFAAQDVASCVAMAAERLGVDVCGGGTWEVVAERWANIYGVAANITNGRVEGLRDACNDLVDESEHATSEKCGDGARNTSACEVGGSNVTLPSKSTDRSTGPLLASLLRELDGARSSGRGVEFGVKALSGLSDILKADGDAVMIGGAVMQVIEGLAEDFGRSSRQREEADHVLEAIASFLEANDIPCQAIMPTALVLGNATASRQLARESDCRMDEAQQEANAIQLFLSTIVEQGCHVLSISGSSGLLSITAKVLQRHILPGLAASLEPCYLDTGQRHEIVAGAGSLSVVVDSIGGDNRTLQVPRFASLALRQGLVQEEEEHSIVDVGWPSVWFGGTISEECQEPGGLDGDDEGCFAAAVYSEVLGEIVTAAMGNLLRVAANLPLAIPVSLASGLLQVFPSPALEDANSEGIAVTLRFPAPDKGTSLPGLWCVSVDEYGNAQELPIDALGRSSQMVECRPSASDGTYLLLAASTAYVTVMEVEISGGGAKTPIPEPVLVGAKTFWSEIAAAISDFSGTWAAWPTWQKVILPILIILMAACAAGGVAALCCCCCPRRRGQMSGGDVSRAAPQYIHDYHQRPPGQPRFDAIPNPQVSSTARGYV